MLIRSIRRAGPWVAFAALWVLLAGACGNDAPTQTVCAPGSVQMCSGANGCVGTRACATSGNSWQACTCQPDGGVLQRLGAACQTNAECPEGAFCLGTDSRQLFGGAPPEGTCVASCDGAEGCAKFADAVCVGAGVGEAGPSPASLCLERCSVGLLSSLKCHGRKHVACAPIAGGSSGDGYCRPVCAQNGECASGVCDPVRGVCAAQAPKDTTLGRRCGAPYVPAEAGPPDATSSPDADVDTGARDDARVDADPDALTGADDASAADATGPEPSIGADASVDALIEAKAPKDATASSQVCDGLCVQLNDKSSVCSHPCVFGETSECAPSSGGLRRGGCLFVTQNGTIGDLGYCGELCDCNDDCIEPTFVCDAFDNADLERAFGRKGACTAPELVLARALACSG